MRQLHLVNQLGTLHNCQEAGLKGVISPSPPSTHLIKPTSQRDPTSVTVTHRSLKYQRPGTAEPLGGFLWLFLCVGKRANIPANFCATSRKKQAEDKESSKDMKENDMKVRSNKQKT